MTLFDVCFRSDIPLVAAVQMITISCCWVSVYIQQEIRVSLPGNSWARQLDVCHVVWAWCAP